jgi:DNA-binding IclR family transcriptional regulator
MTLRLTDLAQRSGVTKTSVYRLAEQLVELGMLDRTDDGYQLGLAMFEIGRHVPLPASLGTGARPILVDLATTLRATVHLAVLDDLDVLYVEKINGRQGFHTISCVGGRMPLNATASGKVLLASAPHRDAILERLVTTGAVKAGDAAALRREVMHADELGYGAEREAIARGWKGIAVAVRGVTGETVAALSAVVPASRNDEREVVQHLRAASGSITRQMRSAAVHHGRGFSTLVGGRQPTKQLA